MKKNFDFTSNFRPNGAELLKTNPSEQPKYNFVGEFSILKNNVFSTKLSKVIIVLFLVIGISISQSFGQRDQITTQSGEKIRCRILDETPNRFMYAYLSPSGKVLRNEIFKNLVSDFKYNFYSSDIVTKGNKLPDGLGGTIEENATSKPRVDTRKSESTKPKTEQTKSNRNNELTETKKKSITNESSSKKESATVEKANEMTKQKEKSTALINEKKATPKKEEKVLTPMAAPKADNEFSNFLKWRLGVKGGLGNMLAKIPTTNAYGLYQEKLLRGYTWGADMAFFPVDNLGIGMMFNDFQAYNKADNIAFINEILNLVK